MEERENIDGGYYLLTHGLDEDTFPGGVLPGYPFLSEGKWEKNRPHSLLSFLFFWLKTNTSATENMSPSMLWS